MKVGHYGVAEAKVLNKNSQQFRKKKKEFDITDVL